jgi:lipopolysaccharide export system permease protein
MTLLQRHFLKEFIKLFAITCIGLSLIITLLDLIKEMDDLMPHDPTIASLLKYASLNFPRYFLYLMPVAALLCSLYTVGHASKTKELVAVMAAGGRVKRLLFPMVLTGVLLSLLGFIIGEFAVPSCSTKAREIKNLITRKAPFPSAYKDGKIWLRAEDGSIVKIDFYMEETNSFRQMRIFSTGEGRIDMIATAGEAAYSTREGTWILKNVRKYQIETGNVEVLDELRYPYLGSPEVFKEEARKPYEMGIMELRRYLARLEEAGFKNLRLTVEMNSKISYPLVSLFMVLLGISFPSRRSIGGLVATAIGLVVSLLYWFGYTMSLSLGYAGVLPPLLAAWAMPLIFCSVSLVLFSKIPE